jgi:hypothetical protein
MIGNKVYGIAPRHCPHFRTVIHEVVVDFTSGSPVVNDNDCIIGIPSSNSFIFNLVKNVNRVLFVNFQYQPATAPAAPADFNAIGIGSVTVSNKFLGNAFGTHKCVAFNFSLRNLVDGTLKAPTGKIFFEVVMQQNEAQ